MSFVSVKRRNLAQEMIVNLECMVISWSLQDVLAKAKGLLAGRNAKSRGMHA